MSEQTAPAEQVDDEAGAKPTADEIAADMAATRERLAGSVDQLAAKLDVKAQAQHKVDDTLAKAQEKVQQTRAQVAASSRSVLDRFLALSRPIQASVGAVPLALLLFVIVRRARR
jgi:Protein of unknown function (DUF3618)